MMRLPDFQYRSPRTLLEAAEMLAEGSPDAMLVAGGTDLLPNMKRRQQTPSTLIGLRKIPELRRIVDNETLTIGAAVPLSTLVDDQRLRRRYTALWQAAAQVATPQLRNMGTLGGNLCLDTRCNYYDQNYEWRKAIDFCMKKDGAICWVAPSSRRCLAVSSSDCAPALMALGAHVTLTSPHESREIPVSDLFRNDGIQYLARGAQEIVARINLPRSGQLRSTYWKLRRRGAFDFPVVGVAAAARVSSDGTVESARIVVGAVASSPLELGGASAALVGRALTDDVIAGAAESAGQVSRPMDNTDFSLYWRKRLVRQLVVYALREIRGDEMGELRRRVSRQMLT